MDMSSMSSMSNDSSLMSMSGMAILFFTSSTTPLYSSAWSPTSTGSYAGTCIFLIILAVIFRSLFALKALVERRWHDDATNRRYIVVAGKTPEAERVRRDTDAKRMMLSERGVEEEVQVVKRNVRGAMPWRLSVDVPRAGLVTVTVGVGYLLMLAVMTMNVGYFLSILGGTFWGELMVGRYIQSGEH